MKDDLISRSALLEKAIGVVVYDEGGWDCNERAVTVEDIENADAVDAETVIKSLPYVKEALEMAKQSLAPVVRCKDCEYLIVGFHGHRWCMAWERVLPMGDDGFCNFGERRDDDV